MLLPKGHIEKGEGTWPSALREVLEETGVQGISFGSLEHPYSTRRTIFHIGEVYLIETLVGKARQASRARSRLELNDAVNIDLLH